MLTDINYKEARTGPIQHMDRHISAQTGQSGENKKKNTESLSYCRERKAMVTKNGRPVKLWIPPRWLAGDGAVRLTVQLGIQII